MERFDSADIGECINIGSGEDVSIRASWWRWLRRRWAIAASLSSIPPGRTARRASCWMALAPAGAGLAREDQVARGHRPGLPGFSGTPGSDGGSGPVSARLDGAPGARDACEAIDMSYNGKQVVVTGADGFIGSHLSGAPGGGRGCGHGAQPLQLVRFLRLARRSATAGSGRPSPGARRYPGRHVRAAAAGGAANSFHLAALIAIPTPYAAPQSCVDTNITGMLNVLQAARACGTGRLCTPPPVKVYGTARVTPITEDHPLQAQSPYSAT